MPAPKLALARVNYSQLYGVYDGGKTYAHRDILAPYQLLNLAAAARAAGAEVSIFDAELDLWSEAQLAREILDWKPDWVGLTATTPDIDLALEVCRLLKEGDPNVKTVLGGAHPTVRAQEVAADVSVDYVATGDGEDVLAELMADRSGLPRKDKIVIGSKPELDRLPMPAHDLIDYSRYRFSDPLRGQITTATVMSARGCPFNCNFCFHDRKVRYRPVDAFIREVEYLYREKGVRYFFVYDDVFLLKRERVLEILEKWRALGLKDAHFQCQSRGNLASPDLLAALKASGCVRVSLGIEAGTDEMLARCDKGVCTDDYRAACRNIAAAGMEPRASFIIGHPYETEETARATIRFAQELELLHANFTVMTPYPGTSVHGMALRGEGIRFTRPEFAKDWHVYRRWGTPIVETNALSSARLAELREEAVTAFYTQPKVYRYYEDLFRHGNHTRYFYRPLNFAWRRKHGTDLPFWRELDETDAIAPKTESEA